MAKGPGPAQRKAPARPPLRQGTTEPGGHGPAAKPGQTTPVQTTGPRVPSRPATGTTAGRSPNGQPPMSPDYQAPEPGPRPKVTAPIPDHTRPRTHEERNA